jgi:hypothetical protein
MPLPIAVLAPRRELEELISQCQEAGHSAVPCPASPSLREFSTLVVHPATDGAAAMLAQADSEDVPSVLVWSREPTPGDALRADAYAPMGRQVSVAEGARHKFVMLEEGLALALGEERQARRQGTPRLTLLTPLWTGAAGTRSTPLLPGLSCTLGSGLNVDLRIPSPRLARSHCRVYPEGGRLWLEDLGSTNRTYLLRPGAPPLALNAPVPLQIGDQFSLAGQAILRLDGQLEEAPGDSAEDFAPLGRPMLCASGEGHALYLQYGASRGALLLRRESFGAWATRRVGTLELCRWEPPDPNLTGPQALEYLEKRVTQHPACGLLADTAPLYQRALSQVPPLEVAAHAARCLSLEGLVVALAVAPPSPQRAHVARAGLLATMALPLVGRPPPRAVLLPSLWGGPLREMDSPLPMLGPGAEQELARQAEQARQRSLRAISERVALLLALPEPELRQRFKVDVRLQSDPTLATLLACAGT